MTEPKDYSSVARLLHWAVAGLIVTQFVLAKLSERAEHANAVVQQIGLLANHKSVGITILGLALVRLLWRLSHRPPRLPVSMPGWQKKASDFAHFALYGFLFALPISGWLMSSASAYSVSYFSLFTLPDLVAADPDLKGTLASVHELLAKALFVIAAVHILAALKHHFVNKDGVMKRMTSVSGVCVFALTAIGAGLALGQTKTLPEETAQQPNAVATDAQPDTPTESEVWQPGAERVDQTGVWQIDYANSEIRFSAEQAGAPFDGAFGNWQAAIWFDAENPENTYFDVSINTGSASTDDADRDGTLGDADWFDTAQFPTARFETQGIEQIDENRYRATAELTIKTVTQEIDFDFSVSEDGNDRILIGTARLDRLALGVGTGTWEDTDTVGQFVDVKVSVQGSVN